MGIATRSWSGFGGAGLEFLFADFDGGFDVMFPPLSEGMDKDLANATITYGGGPRWQLL